MTLKAAEVTGIFPGAFPSETLHFTTGAPGSDEGQRSEYNRRTFPVQQAHQLLSGRFMAH